MIVYSAIYGGYDHLKPVTVDVPHVLFTDQKIGDPLGWDVVVEPPMFDHPRLSAKWWKMHPPFDGHCLWIDGSISVLQIEFVHLVDRLLDDADMAMQRHPKRDCIYEEAKVAQPLPKYQEYDLMGQVSRYWRAGWPKHAGLWQCGIMGWSGSKKANRLGAAWFSHCELLTYQDQIALPVLAARYQVRIADIPGPFWDNPAFSYGHHLRDD